MRPQLLLPILFMTIVSCAPFSPQVMQEVKRDIAFSEALKDPEAFKGEAILWGGIIIETLPRADDTLIIVRQTDLDFQKQPKDPDTSAGRFIIRHRGFLDPSIYSQDREVTVAGTIAGKEERPVGESRYTYPVIDTLDLRLWERRVAVPPYYDPWYRDRFLYPWHPYPWHHRPYRW